MQVSQFSFEEQFIKGVFVVTPFMAPDERGILKKTFEKTIFRNNNIDINVAEIIENRSKKGTLRGLHMQHTMPQGKLVRVVRGSVFDVAVDIRKFSPTFGKHFGIELSDQNNKMLYIPEGCLHGMLALEEDTIFTYAMSQKYIPAYDGGVRWDDPEIGIVWPIDLAGHIILSEKDKTLPTLKEYMKIIDSGE